MENISTAVKLLIILSPVIFWGILIWRVEKWDRQFRDMPAEELRRRGYYHKKRILTFLLWASSFVAITGLLFLFAKIGLQK